jgi:hypothetical protein
VPQEDLVKLLLNEAGGFTKTKGYGYWIDEQDQDKAYHEAVKVYEAIMQGPKSHAKTLCRALACRIKEAGEQEAFVTLEAFTGQVFR